LEDYGESSVDCALQDVGVHVVGNLENRQANFQKHLSTAAEGVLDGVQVTEDKERVASQEVNMDSALVHLVAEATSRVGLESPPAGHFGD